MTQRSWAGASYWREPSQKLDLGEPDMGRGLLLWLIGIPLPILLLLYFLGYLGG